MAKFSKPPSMPMLDTGEGAPTLGKSGAKSKSTDGTVRGKAKAPGGRGLFGALGGSGKLKMAKQKTGPKAGGASARAGYGTPPMMGAGNLEADTKKYGAMMKGRK